MRSCIYVRAYRREKSHNRTGIERQVRHCRELGRQHNLIIEGRHIFRDMDHDGAWPPSCWALDEDGAVRPALSAMIDAIEGGKISSVVVFRADRLATSSELLQGLDEVFEQYDIKVIVSSEALDERDDPADRFAVSMLRSRFVYDMTAEKEKDERLRARKLDELERLRAKVLRLEAEIAAID